MSKTPSTNPILKRLTAIALALPEARRELSGSHASFRVRKKTFAYFLDNHHGDGIVAVTCKVLPKENAALAKAQPKRYYLPAYIGPRGWVALRLDLPQDQLVRSPRTSPNQLPSDRPQTLSLLKPRPRRNLRDGSRGETAWFQLYWIEILVAMNGILL
jgi:hypothetical protein